MGRPSKFNIELSEKIIELVAKGLDDKEVAEKLGISLRTFYIWKRDNKEFLQSYDTGLEYANELVVTSLFRRCLGYSVPVETKIHEWTDALGAQHKETHIIEKHWAPDVSAIKYWLNNRCPEEWKNKIDIEIKPPEKSEDQRPPKELVELLKSQEGIKLLEELRNRIKKSE